MVSINLELVVSMLDCTRSGTGSNDSPGFHLIVALSDNLVLGRFSLTNEAYTLQKIKFLFSENESFFKTIFLKLRNVILSRRQDNFP